METILRKLASKKWVLDLGSIAGFILAEYVLIYSLTLEDGGFTHGNIFILFIMTGFLLGAFFSAHYFAVRQMINKVNPNAYRMILVFLSWTILGLVGAAFLSSPLYEIIPSVIG